MAIPGVPVVAPAGVPEIAGAPLRERSGMRLRVGRDAQPRQAQTRDGGNRCC
ncbi:hypothetical protein MOTT27_01539 [Mycobacterium intracellulare subsp. yongonense]|nr:hypothetical protein MOTT27_01539 [Mycobacterium intracellulare subsp. yongonense]